MAKDIAVQSLVHPRFLGKFQTSAGEPLPGSGGTEGLVPQTANQGEQVEGTVTAPQQRGADQGLPVRPVGVRAPRPLPSARPFPSEPACRGCKMGFLPPGALGSHLVRGQYSPQVSSPCALLPFSQMPGTGMRPHAPRVCVPRSTGHRRGAPLMHPGLFTPAGHDAHPEPPGPRHRHGERPGHGRRLSAGRQL